MLKFTVKHAIELMKNRQYVRNLGIIAHIDHGKSSLADSLLAGCGLLSEDLAGKKGALIPEKMNRKEESQSKPLV